MVSRRRARGDRSCHHYRTYRLGQRDSAGTDLLRPSLRSGSGGLWRSPSSAGLLGRAASRAVLRPCQCASVLCATHLLRTSGSGVLRCASRGNVLRATGRSGCAGTSLLSAAAAGVLRAAIPRRIRDVLSALAGIRALTHHGCAPSALSRSARPASHRKRAGTSKQDRPRAGRPSKADAAQLGERIVDAAGTLFFTLGYGATTIEGIARRARISKRTLYVRFADKASLFDAVVRRTIARLRPPPNVPLVDGATIEEILQ